MAPHSSLSRPGASQTPDSGPGSRGSEEPPKAGPAHRCVQPCSRSVPWGLQWPLTQLPLTPASPANLPGSSQARAPGSCEVWRPSRSRPGGLSEVGWSDPQREAPRPTVHPRPPSWGWRDRSPVVGGASLPGPVQCLKDKFWDTGNKLAGPAQGISFRALVQECRPFDLFFASLSSTLLKHCRLRESGVIELQR